MSPTPPITRSPEASGAPEQTLSALGALAAQINRAALLAVEAEPTARPDDVALALASGSAPRPIPLAAALLAHFTDPLAMSAIPGLSNQALATLFLVCTHNQAPSRPELREILEAVCAVGFYPNEPITSKGSTPLMCAVYDKNRVAADWLIPASDLTVVNGEGCSALMIACQSLTPDIALIKKLLPGSDARQISAPSPDAHGERGRSAWDSQTKERPLEDIHALFAQPDARTALCMLHNLSNLQDNSSTCAAAELLLSHSDLFFRDRNGDTFMAIAADHVARGGFDEEGEIAVRRVFGSAAEATRAANPTKARAEAARIAREALLHLRFTVVHRGIHQGANAKRSLPTKPAGLIAMLSILASVGLLTPKEEKEAISWANILKIAVPAPLLARKEARVLRAVMARSAQPAPSSSGPQIATQSLSPPPAAELVKGPARL